MTAEEIVKIIRVELLKQAARHRQSATKKMRRYYQDQVKIGGLIDAVRLEIISESLQGLGEALTLQKIEEWRRDQEECKDG